MNHLNVTELRPLISPAVLVQDLPASESLLQQVHQTRDRIQSILCGHDSRLLVVVGPCSIHDTQAALEYAEKLSQIQDPFAQQLCLVMRVYFEKPRTSQGWKGLINDPLMDYSFDINKGLHLARKLLIDINQLGVACGTEFLDVMIPPFISDLISWGAIGARTTESQIHRQLASSLPMPVGFKNGTTGNVQIAIDAVNAARHPHQYVGITSHGTPAIFMSAGNACGHVILRGASDHTNYDAQHVQAVAEQLQNNHLPGRLMVDLSHGNSQKDHTQQPRVARDVCSQIQQGSQAIAEVMMESHLVAGKQTFQPNTPLEYGVSITDACIGWHETAELLAELAEAVEQRRRREHHHASVL